MATINTTTITASKYLNSLQEQNIISIFEALCKMLTRAIINENKELARSIKHVIIKGIKNQIPLKEELDVYRAIAHSNFGSKEINKAYIAELLSQHRKKINEQRLLISGHKYHILLEELKRQKIKEENVMNIIATSTNNDLYEAIDIMVKIASSIKKWNINESRNFYEALEVVHTHSLKRSTITLKEALQKLKPIKKVPKKIFSDAIVLFEKKYKNTLSESIKQLLEDYLYYSKTDRFVSATAKRLKNTINETRLTANKKGNSDIAQPILENMEACYKQLEKILSENTISENEENIFKLVVEVAHHIDISEELKKIS